MSADTIAHPTTSATLTVRVIKSFEYRTERSLVLHGVNLETTTVGELKRIVLQVIQRQPEWERYRNVELDTVKLYTRAHGAKTSNLIINLDHDDWIYDDDNLSLASLQFENETEVSFFNRESYEIFKKHPEIRWDI